MRKWRWGLRCGRGDVLHGLRKPPVCSAGAAAAKEAGDLGDIHSREQRRTAAKQQLATAAQQLLQEPEKQLPQLKGLLELVHDEDAQVRCRHALAGTGPRAPVICRSAQRAARALPARARTWVCCDLLQCVLEVGAVQQYENAKDHWWILWAFQFYKLPKFNEYLMPALAACCACSLVPVLIMRPARCPGPLGARPLRWRGV